MLKNIILFHGENQVAAKKALKDWQTQFSKKHGDYNISELETANDQQNILNKLLTPSLLGEHRLFIIHDFFKQQESDTSLELINNLTKVPTENIVTFFESTPLDKRKKASKQLLKTVTNKEFAAKNKYNLPQYIQNLAHTYGKEISPQLQTKLSELFLNNQDRLHQEIKKLATYTPGSQINETDLNAVGALPGSTSVFAITDSLTQPLPNRISTLHQLWEQGEDLLKLTYLLLNQIRLLIITHELNGQINSLKIYKIHPFVQQKLKASYRRFELNKLQTMLTQLGQIDIDLKQGRLSYSKNNTQEILNRLEQALIF